MALYRRAARRDTSERPIIAALEGCGWSVVQLSGRDVPDLAIARAGRTFLAEVKTGAAKLRPGQQSFTERWPAQVLVFRSVDDVITFARSGVA